MSLSIIRTAYQWGIVPQQVVDDLAQETYLKLCADRCRLLQSFATLHPEAVVGYVKTIAVNVAHDYFKSTHSQKRGSGEVEQPPEDMEAGALARSPGGPQAIEREVLLKQIDGYLGACSEGPDQDRDRLIFWLYYQQGMSAKAISTLPTVGLSAKGVESAVFRLTRLVRERVVRKQGEGVAGPPPGGKGLSPAESY